MKNNKNSNIFWGLVFISVAIMSLMTSLKIINIHVFSISFIVIFGLFGLITVFRKRYFLGLYSLAFSLNYFMDIYYKEKPLGVFELFLIATAIAIGLQLIFGKRNKFSFEKNFTFTTDSQNYTTYEKDYEETITMENTTDTYMKIKTQFAGDTRYIYSPNLQQIDIDNQFAGTSIYFQERTLKNDLTINVDCQLGAVEFFFPKEWNIVDNLNRTLAGVDYGHKSNGAESSPYTVYLCGSVQLGAVQIKYI